MDMDEAINEVHAARRAVRARHDRIVSLLGPLRFLAGETARYATPGADGDVKARIAIANVEGHLAQYTISIKDADAQLRDLDRTLRAIRSEADAAEQRRAQRGRQMKV